MCAFVVDLLLGYVNMEVLLFIWDQYMIGLDAPGFHDEFLPIVMAIYLMLVKEKLRGSDTVRLTSQTSGSHGWITIFKRLEY